MPGILHTIFFELQFIPVVRYILVCQNGKRIHVFENMSYSMLPLISVKIFCDDNFCFSDEKNKA